MKGNGKYKIEKFIEGDYKFPEMVNLEGERYTFNMSDFLDIINRTEKAITGFVLHPHVEGFYLTGKGVYTTNMVRFLKSHTNLISEEDEPILVPQTVSKFIKYFNDDIQLQKEDKLMIFSDGKLRVYCKEVENKEQYPDYEGLRFTLSGHFTLGKSELSDSLNRMLVYKDVLQGEMVKLKVTDEDNGTIHLKSVIGKAEEKIKLDSKDFEGEIELAIDAEELIQLLKAFDNIVLDFKIGSGLPLKIEQENLEGLLAPINL